MPLFEVNSSKLSPEEEVMYLVKFKRLPDREDVRLGPCRIEGDKVIGTLEFLAPVIDHIYVLRNLPPVKKPDAQGKES